MTTSELPMPSTSGPDDDATPAVDAAEADRRVMLHMPVDVRSASIAFVAVAAAVAMLRWMDDFFVPVLLGVMVSYALTPLVDRLERLRVPRMLGAGLILAAVLGSSAGVAYTLRGQADAFLTALPHLAAKVRQSVVGKSSSPRGTLARVEAAATAIESATNGSAPVSVPRSASGGATGAAGTNGTADSAAPGNAASTAVSTDADGAVPPRPAPKTELPMVAAPKPTAPAEHSVRGMLLAGTLGVATFAGQALVVLFVALFLLAAGNAFRRKIIGIGGATLSDRRLTLEAFNEMHDQIQRYLLIQLATSVVVGVATAAVFALFGLDNALVWGIVASVANLVPYLGSVATSGLAAVAGLVQFGRMDLGLWLAASSFAIHLVVGNLLTPWLSGKASRMSPFVVFVGVLFFGWLWGVAGLILAFPILVAVKITCERVDSLKPLSDLMSA